MYGIKINKLIFTGPNLDDIELEFKKGVNVITGGSDTGKTYAFKCIDFLFGKSKSPSRIPERGIFQYVNMEFQCYSGETYTVRRSFKDNSQLEVFRCSFDKVGDKTPDKFDASSGSKLSISSFYMSLFGYKDKVRLPKDAKGKFKQLTIRLFIRHFLIDEVEIIEENLSPLLSSKQYSDHYFEMEVFKHFLTGFESTKTTKVQDKSKSKLKIDNQIELLNEIINENNRIINDYQLINERTSIELIQSGISTTKKEIDLIQENINELTKQRVEQLNKKYELNKSYINTNETKKRFELLQQQYSSEIERYEFIYEGAYLLNQLPIKKCPVCDGDIKSNDFDASEIVQAFESEKLLLNQKLKSLLDSIYDLDLQLNNISFNYDENNLRLSEIEKTIEEISDNQLNTLLLRYDELNTSKIELIKYYNLVEENKKLEVMKNRLIGNLEPNIKKDDNDNADLDVFKLSVNSLFDNMSKKLIKWEFADTVSISSDSTGRDLLINDKHRRDYGKGYRAIIKVAYTLALFDLLQSRGSFSPGFVVIDSPFTAYRGGDELSEEGVKVSNNIVRAFYTDVADEYRTQQIIIMENDRTPKIENLNEIHFSKNNEWGRYGLF